MRVRFQFTHPGKGATAKLSGWSLHHSCFNSRTLGRVRPGMLVPCLVRELFQFTHPGKGATISNNLTTKVFVVSIHAPWEGCDSMATTLSRCSVMFQFTHPGKGATIGRTTLLRREMSFNSRTLGRVRRSRVEGMTRSDCFNSRTLGRVRLFLACVQ